MTPFVSVIIPAHNGEPYLAQAIDSVLCQKHAPLEIIVVDDGSTDGTAGLVAAMAAQHGKSVRYVFQLRRGPAAARNLGIAAARGDLISFLDHDDLWAPNCLARHIEYLETHPEIEIVQGLIVQMQRVPAGSDANEFTFVESSEPYHFINLGSAIYRKRVFVCVGGLDETLWDADDTDWFIRAWEKNIPKVVLPHVMLYYRRHGTNLTQEAAPQLLPRLFKRHLDRLRAASKSPLDTAFRSPRANIAALYRWATTACTADLMIVTRTQTRTPEIELRLAEIWQQRGHVERAMEGYRRILNTDPHHALAQLYFADLLLQQKRVREAIAVYTHALERHPHEARLHKGLTNALVAQDSFEAAFVHYGLDREDTRAVEVEPSDVLCCLVVRNESLRLPYFLEYYRAQGIAKFFVIDNGSTDDTSAFLLRQPDVYLWRSDLSFQRANFGAAWFELLLRRYGVNHWWVMVDTDELFYYPDCETVSIPQLCRRLEQNHKKAVNAVLLDMYSDVPIRETHHCAGQDFRETCPFFDRSFYRHQYADAGPYRNQTAFTGGMRSRVFGEGDNFYLSKVPLLKYDPGVVLAGGQHWTSHPQAAIAEGRACLLHFKYISTFPRYVEEEIKRQEHADAALQYRQYAQALAQDPALNLFHPAHSVRLQDSAQLVELGIMASLHPTQSVTHSLFARFQLAKAWARSGNLEHAVDGFRQVLAAEPEYVPAQLQLGHSLLKLGRVDNALDCYAAVLTLAPDESEARIRYDFLQAELKSDVGTTPAQRPRLENHHGGKLNLDFQNAFRSPRSWWPFALRALAPLHNERGVLFDDCIEENFARRHWQAGIRDKAILEKLDAQGLFRQLATSEELGLVPYREPWVGVVHNPPNMPGWFHYHESPQSIFEQEIWKISLEQCQGLFTFSEYAGAWLRSATDLPVSVLTLPTEISGRQFDFEKFLANPNKKIVQVGWWLRQLSAIYQLPLALNNPLRYEKVRLVPQFFDSADAYLNTLLAREFKMLPQVEPRFFDNTRVQQHLSHAEYDALLSENIAFAMLYDANANNLVVECIARATPLLINRLPAVIEYLGEGYPLYFEDLEQAAQKALDLDLLQHAHEYLKTVDTRPKLTGDSLLADFRASAVYQALQTPLA